MRQDQQTNISTRLLEETEENNRFAKRTGTFTDNMKLPIHRWFRYSAGFSSDWVRDIIQTNKALTKKGVILDPFAGSGTTILAAEQEGIQAVGIEAHSFVYRVAQAKLCWNSNSNTLTEISIALIKKAQKIWESINTDTCPALLLKCYDTSNLRKLEALRICYIETHNEHNSNEERLLWLAITSILRECSNVGTAQWQYVLPNKSKKRVLDPFEALEDKIMLFTNDIHVAKNLNFIKSGQIHKCDSRSLSPIQHESVSLVVTSPPYPNNYDYADATRLELTYWREVQGWGDLHDHIRKDLITSCSQHSAKNKIDLDTLLQNKTLDPIRQELEAVCHQLAEVRLNKGGKKTYHTMIASYFTDIALTWKSLNSVCQNDAKICFVIGDSAPYGVYVPVDKWMSKLALSAGFKNPRFEKIRDRNIKWKNRKHSVPLKEGNLWVEK